MKSLQRVYSYKHYNDQKVFNSYYVFSVNPHEFLASFDMPLCFAMGFIENCLGMDDYIVYGMTKNGKKLWDVCYVHCTGEEED